MPRILISLAACCLLALSLASCSDDDPATVQKDDSLREGVVAYWNFDDGLAAGIGGAGYDAVARNGAATGGVGKFGGAAVFDRSQLQYLLVQSPVVSPTSDHAYSAWYCLDQADIAVGERFFVLESLMGTEPSEDMAYAMSYGLRNFGAGNAGEVFCMSDNQSWAESFDHGACNAWHNIVVNYQFDADNDEGFHTIFLDGEYVGSVSSWEVLSTTGGLIIGAHRAANVRNFDGRIDDVAVWNRQLDAAEIAGLQTAPLATATPKPGPDGPVNGVYTATFATGTTPAGEECGITWTEGGLDLTLVETTADDRCEGSCSFDLDNAYGFESCQLWPGRLTVDLSGIPFERVVVDYDDNCSVGCTKAFLYGGGTILNQAENPDHDPSVFTLYRNGATVDMLAVSSCEGEVTEIRVYLATE